VSLPRLAGSAAWQAAVGAAADRLRAGRPPRNASHHVFGFIGFLPRFYAKRSISRARLGKAAVFSGLPRYPSNGHGVALARR